jgi:rhodanese-related sulfurtransferase
MSTQAAQEMLDAGASGFSELEGGFIEWEAAGLPFEV